MYIIKYLENINVAKIKQKKGKITIQSQNKNKKQITKKNK